MTDSFLIENNDAVQMPTLPPDISKEMPEDERYLLLLTRPLQVCRDYRPKFGQGGKGVSVEEFQVLYKADSFYQWMGLDSPLMYAAHKAAGGMTSIYRQLGIGAQWIFNQVLQDYLGLTKQEAAWNYQVPTATEGKSRTLSLDGKIELSHITKLEAQERVQMWQKAAMVKLLLPNDTQNSIIGTVFEARQGYKSKDSKRQNADISNAVNAYVHHYIPTLLLFSNQLDNDLAERYAKAHWLILRGTLSGTPTDSTYIFCRDIVGYDLAAFFERNSDRIRSIMEQTLKSLLQA